MAKKDTGGISASDIAKVASANASISLDISSDVKQSMLDFISVANRMVSGSKIGQYFADTETLAKRLATAVRACNDDLKHINDIKPSNAKEVVNTFNALKASANGADVSSFFDKLDGGFRGVMSTVESAQAKVGKFVEGFSEADFSRMFGSYQNIKTWADTLGLGTKEVENLMSSLTQLSGTDVSALTKQLEDAWSQVRSLNEELTSVKSGTGFRELEAELEDVQSALTNAESKIERLRDKAVYEFRQYLSANLIDPDQFDDEFGLPRFEYYIDNIRNGTFSAREAITEFRTEYEHLFENADQNQGVFNTAQVEAFTAKLEEIFTRVQEIGAYIQNTTSNAPGLVANAVEKDLENINKEEQALRHVIDEGGQLGQVAQIVEGVAEASSDGTQSMGQMSEQTVKLIESLTSLGQAGEESLAAISSIFRNISGIKDLTVNTEEFSKLKVALESLKDMTGIEKIGLLSNINLQGLSGLSVSKASMYNLATYLPIISRDTDIGKLQALSQINLSNFNKDNLSVSKATMDNLKSLIETISGKDVNVTGDGQTQKLTAEQETVERLNTSYKTHSEAVARAIDEEQKKAIVSSELTAKLQREKEAMDAVSGAAEKGTASGQKYSAVWDKMFLGKFTAEFAKVKAQFDALQDKPAKLAQNMRLLEDAEKQMREATTMEDKVGAYEQFLTVIDVVRTQIGAVNAEARNSNADFKNLLNAVRQASAAMDGIGNSAFTNKLKEMHARIKGIADNAVIDKFKELQKAYIEMQSVFGTSGPNTEQDYTALANAHARWKNALSGLNQALTTNRAVSAAANVANKDNARTAKEIASASKEAQGQVNELSNVFAGLKDKTKFDTSAFERMSALLAEVNNESNDATTRQNALQKLNVLLGESAEKLNELSAAEREQSKLNNELENAEKRRSSMLQQLDTMLQQATAAERRYALSQATPELKEKYQQLKQTSAGIREMANQLRSGVQPTDEMGNRIRKLKNDLGECTTAFKTSGNVISRWASAGLQQLKSRLTYTLGLAAIFTKTTQEIKKMITTAVELDSAMNTLQIVTRGSNADMEAYAKNVSQMAKETAQSTKDLIDATTVYARLGYSMDESAILSKYTAMLQGVGDIDASSAQNAMTAIIKAFNRDVSDVEDVMNKLVVVGNNFPISVSQLAEGMNNAGSMLAVAGNSLEESIALLTAANTTVQNISKSSTGLRTIAARIRKTTTGEDGDEIVEEAKYQEMVNALTKQHVSLVDQVTGQYRSTYDIMKDIAAVWDKMTSMEQAAVIEALAGTRQQNIFTSLVTQFKEAEGALKRMDNAAGELQESYDIYLNSIQAHVQTMKAAFDELSMDFVDSEFAKNAIDLLTKLIEILDALITRYGVVRTTIAAIGLPVVMKNLDKIVDVFKKIAAFSSAKGFAGLEALGPVTEKLAGVLSKISALAPVAVPALVALAGAAVAAKVIDGKSFESAAKQAASTKQELESLEEKQQDILSKIKELNAEKGRGDFSVQQQTELTTLEAQNAAIQAQIDLLKERYRVEHEHELETARNTARKLLTDADDKNGYSTDEAIATYLDAKERYQNSKTGPLSRLLGVDGAKNMFDAADAVLQGQLTTYREILSTLDEEVDKELIDQIQDKIMQITSAVSDIPIAVLEARRELERIQKNGTVNLLQRPVIDTEVLKAAGWNEEGGNGATVYSSTYSNKDNSVAMNFTPIIVDENGSYVGVLTPEQLQAYAEGVINGTSEDTLNLKIGATFEGPEAVERAVEEAEKVHELHELVYGEDLKKVQKFHRDVQKLSKRTMAAIKQYLKDGTSLTKRQEQELQDFLRVTGYTAEEFAQMFSQMFAEKPSSNGVSETAKKSIADLASFRDELDQTKKALEDYQKAMEGGEKDDAIKQAADIYKGALEDIQSGKIDTNRLHAAAELFFSKDWLNANNWDMKAVAQALQSDMFKYLFDPESETDVDFGLKFADYVKSHFTEANGVWMEGNTFFYKSVEDVARAFNMSTEAANMFLSALDMYGTNTMRSTQENNELIDSFYDLQNKLGSAKEAIKSIVAEMHEEGMDAVDIHAVLGDLQNAGVIDLDATELHQTINEALDSLEDVDNTEADPRVGIEYSNFIRGYNDIVLLLNDLGNRVVSPTVALPYVSQDGEISGTAKPVTTEKKSRAGGKRPGDAGGDTLVNELGPELISDNGRAFIANGGKPGFVRLSENAIVFTADETKDILRGKRNVNGRALAGGNVGRGSLIGRLMHGGTKARASWKCPVCGRINTLSNICGRCGYNHNQDLNAGVNRSAYGSPTAVATGQNMGGSGVQTNPVTGRTVIAVMNSNGTATLQEAVQIQNSQNGISWAPAQNWQCPRCGRTIAGGKNMCGYCGYPGADKRARKGDVNAGQGTKDGSRSGGGLAGSGGGNNVGGADYASSSDPQKVDWIAVKINRLERSIADLEKIATSGFKTLDKRLDAAKSQIKDITSEISVMESAYNRYLAEAEKVDLSADIKQKIKQGAIDIASYDDETRKQIDEYTEW